jgi:hypothetical protein
VVARAEGLCGRSTIFKELGLAVASSGVFSDAGGGVGVRGGDRNVISIVCMRREGAGGRVNRKGSRRWLDFSLIGSADREL